LVCTNRTFLRTEACLSHRNLQAPSSISTIYIDYQITKLTSHGVMIGHMQRDVSELHRMAMHGVELHFIMDELLDPISDLLTPALNGKEEAE
jgi:hypothetical protein